MAVEIPASHDPLANGNEIMVVDQGPDEVSLGSLYLGVGLRLPIDQRLTAAGNLPRAWGDPEQCREGFADEGLVAQLHAVLQHRNDRRCGIEDELASSNMVKKRLRSLFE